MNGKTFKKVVCEHLKKYNILGPGIFRGRYYSYIIPLSYNKAEVVKEHCLCKNAKALPFLYDKKVMNGHAKPKLHQYAHHLNSSQIMCYNFFRPLIEGISTPSKKLVELLNSIGVEMEWNSQAKAIFEYVETNESTNFDFYVISGNTEVFCEIKYTESDFNKKGMVKEKDDNRRYAHYHDIYAQMVKECNILKKEIEKDSGFEKSFMDEHYQLFRNTIRAREKNRYVLFIAPNDREDLKKSYESFRKKYVKDGIHTVKFVAWEELIRKSRELAIDINEFEKRYFGYPKDYILTNLQ